MQRKQCLKKNASNKKTKGASNAYKFKKMSWEWMTTNSKK